MPRVILASSSPRRRELLALIGIPHDIMPADIDESYLPGETASSHAERLAREKAARVASAAPDAVVIGADTIVVVDGDVLGKPRDEAHAAEMLRRLSGRAHRVITAVAAVRNGTTATAVEEVRVTFRPLSEREIAAYIATGEPMDKAGAYGIQGFGATIVERVEGDYFAVMGLALNRLVRLLEGLGLRYEFGPLRADGGGRRAEGGDTADSFSPPPALRPPPA
jgi:septum formation protein